MAKKKTKQEILLELKDYAVIVANLLNCKEEEKIEKRINVYLNFKTWTAESKYI